MSSALKPRDLALAFALVAAVASARMLSESHAELTLGEHKIAAGQAVEGIRHLESAAHLYLPGSPYTRRAYDALDAHARACETRGQNDQALVAWRAIRSSALATRWVVVPYRSELTRANRRIARLMALTPAAPEDRAMTPASLEEKHLALLAEDRAPEAAWMLLMGVGLAAWLSAALWSARHGWSDAHGARKGELARAAGVFVVGAALFVLGLWRA